MQKGKIVLFLILFFTSFYPIISFYRIAEAATSENVGFVSTNIRYSKDPFMEGDKIKIYTLVINPDTRTFLGTVIFFDKNTLLGTKSFSVPANGVKDIFIDWTATAGDHLIYGKIENAKFLISKGNYEEIYLTENETEKSERTVEKTLVVNTNSDSNIGNTVDSSSLGAIQNIQKLITEKTPDFIAKPIEITASAIDGFREDLGIASDKKKEETKTEINNLNIVSPTPDLKDLKNPQKTTVITTTDNTNKKSKIFKPFKYVELFFLTLSSFIFNNKLIFYGLLAVILFLLGRFAWRKIF